VKLFSISVLALAAMSVADAGTITLGEIEVGGQTAGPITSPTNAFGLTAAYIGSGNSGSWTERNFAANLFSNDSLSNSTLGGSTAPDATPGSAGSQQFVDPNNGVTFALMNDGSTGANLNQFWGSPNNTAPSLPSSITAPIGISGLTDASILLNDWFGPNGVASNDTITFNFTGDGAKSVNLSNGNQIADATACSAASPTWTTTATNCTQFAQSVSNAGGGSPFIPTTTDIAWSANYSNANATGATIYSGTTGNLNLYDISFNLSAFAGDTLTSITLTDNNNLQNSSRLVLSAITVVTPEPSTVLLFVAGLGVMGFIGRRRKARL
jgi:PEP-CTERM motif